MKRIAPAGFIIPLLALVTGQLLAPTVAMGQPLPPPRRESTPPTEPAPFPRAMGRTPAGNLLTVPLGGNKRLQMKTHQVIETVVNDKENVATVTPVPGDPTTVNVSGKEGGVTYLALTGADRSVERYEIVVQLDLDYLRSVLERAVPAANLDIIPAGAGSVAINGTVTRAEDIDVVLRIAASVLGGPDRVINHIVLTGPMQVQLDVVIARVSRTKLRELSFDFLNRGAHHVVGGAIGTVTPQGAGALGAPPTSPGGSAATNVFLGLFNSQQEVFFFLHALKIEGVAKELAVPRVMTLSGRSATFVSGGDQAVPEFTGGGAGGAVGSIRFEPFGVRVSVLPIVLGDGRIQLEIEPEVSQIDKSGQSAGPVPGTALTEPGRISERVHTTVVMEDGQTYVLGGIIEQQVDTTVTRLPVLGEIPYLGVFFSSKTDSHTENEVVIVVTPHLVDAMSCAQAPKIFPGQETRNPDDYELFLEGILEAPHGSREVIQGNRYVPAWKNGPSAGAFPCNGAGCSAHGGADCNLKGGYASAPVGPVDQQPIGTVTTEHAAINPASGSQAPAQGETHAGGPSVQDSLNPAQAGRPETNLGLASSEWRPEVTPVSHYQQGPVDQRPKTVKQVGAVNEPTATGWGN